MDWLQAAAAFPPLEEKDIAILHLSKEEKEQVLTLFNRAVSNAQSDSADIAMIALKKLLTQYPAWGEAALLYGICLAIDGKFKRALASFEHAISAGLLTEDLSYLAQVCYRDAGVDYAQENQHAHEEEDSAGKNIFSSLFTSRKNHSNVFREIDTEERGHMQAPILTRAPRSPGKARLASDRERRDVMMQANAPNSDSSDDDIVVSIPKTPAEKLRIAVIAIGSVLLAVLLGLAVWFYIIPAVAALRENSSAAPKLDYLLAALEANKTDPQISQILTDYQNAYPSGTVSIQPAQTETAQPAQTETAQAAQTDALQAGPANTVTPSPTPAGGAAEPAEGTLPAVSPSPPAESETLTVTSAP